MVNGVSFSSIYVEYSIQPV